jgi:hypothetical protein
MKQAKTEAAAVVAKYKAEKEAEFIKKASSSSLDAENAAMMAETDREIAQMKIDFEKNKDVSGAGGRPSVRWAAVFVFWLDEENDKTPKIAFIGCTYFVRSRHAPCCRR